MFLFARKIHSMIHKKFHVFVVLSTVAAALWEEVMVTPALAQENMSMSMDHMNNMNIMMDNSTKMGNGMMPIN
jgi:hypothetical protein